MTMADSTEGFNLAAERDRLQAEIYRLRAERLTGVPAELLGKATTEDDALALAQRLLEWKGPPPQPQPPSEPFYPVTQYRRDDLRYMTPDELAQAYREGRLAQIGAPAPPPTNRRPHAAT
jgi:hypothetical protein